MWFSDENKPTQIKYVYAKRMHRTASTFAIEKVSHGICRNEKSFGFARAKVFVFIPRKTYRRTFSRRRSVYAKYVMTGITTKSRSSSPLRSDFSNPNFPHVWLEIELRGVHVRALSTVLFHFFVFWQISESAANVHDKCIASPFTTYLQNVRPKFKWP